MPEIGAYSKAVVPGEDSAMINRLMWVWVCIFRQSDMGWDKVLIQHKLNRTM